MKFSDKYSEFLKYATKDNLFDEQSRILIALSGGADSMVLLHFLYTAYKQNKIKSLHAFHMNHSLRDVADSEEDFVRNYCEVRKIPFTSVKEDVSLYAKSDRISEETAGRKLRYEHLGRLKRELGYDYIATAHHADDNAETILMRLIRGTGIKGMGGIHPKENDLIRPLLFMTKDEIYAVAEEENIPYVTDMSNFENDYFRNRVRNTIIPLIKDENPSFADSALRTGNIMREAWDYISRVTDKIPVMYDGEKATVKLCDIMDADEFIIANAVMKMCFLLTGADNVGYESVKKVSSLIITGGTRRWQYHLPGIVISSGDGIVSAVKNTVKDEVILYRHEIIPGRNYDFSDIRVKILTKILKKDENFIINSYIKSMDYDKIKGSLYISPKEASQKFRPVGRNMTKSVGKFLSDLKVPSDVRNRLPVYSDDDGAVMVGSIEIDERVKITHETKNILQIETIIY